MKKDISIFDNYFEPQIMERGIGYCYNDLVKDINKKEHSYTCKIEGTRVYNVSLKLNDNEDKIIEANCNCPYSIDREKYCKHIYALLYSLKGEKLDTKPIKKTKYTPPTNEIVNIKCPNCGSNLRIENPRETIECTYCHSSFALDIRLTGQAKRLKEIIDQADLYFGAEDFKEAYYEYAKAHDLDKDNKYVEYYMKLSAKRKNIETNLSLNDYSSVYDKLKEAYNIETDEQKKKDLIQSFINLLTTHANKYLNGFGLSGKSFWIELDGIIDYFNRLLKEFNVSKETKRILYKNDIDILKIELENYDTFKESATNSKVIINNKLLKIQLDKKLLEKK
jgi:uncharacterized CHY-type Zn-finger protein